MATGRVVFLHRPGQPQGALLDEIEQIQAFALIALGQVDNHAKVGRNHLILSPFAPTYDYFLFIAVLAGRTAASSELARLSDDDHRLNLPAQHEFLLWRQ